MTRARRNRSKLQKYSTRGQKKDMDVLSYSRYA